jgi:predicted MFS family arabinose efflux permease
VTDQLALPARGGWSPRTLWALFLLTMVAMFSIADRAILAIVQEPIKHELKLTDGDLGLLNGVAFAVLYAFVGLPVARWSETRNRTHLLSFVVGVWSLVTAMFGLATGFVQLMMARALVGAAESGSAPMSHSLLSDTFARHARARAMSLYSAGIPLGLLFGGALGGYAAHHWGWRVAFFVVGLPGVVLGLLIGFTTREPPRGQHDNIDMSLEAPSFMETLRRLTRKPTFNHIVWASGTAGFAIYGVNAFIASYFIRQHAMNLGQVGFLVGTGQGIAGLVGTLAGGLICDHYAVRDLRAYMWVPIVSLGVAGVLFIAAFSVGDTNVAVGLMIAAYFFSGAKTGPSWAATQNLAHPRSRAVAAAIVTLTITFVGSGLGPTAVGYLSDYLAGHFFPAALGHYAQLCPGGRPSPANVARLGEACRVASAGGVRGALILAAAVFLWATLHYVFGLKTVRKDMEADWASA